MSLELTSTAFQEGQSVPPEYTADGRNLSPPLTWHDPPAGTKSFALICEDPDAPRGTFTHWVVFNIPAEARELPEGVQRSEGLANGTRQGRTDFGKVGYFGPKPPEGKPHRYFFKLFDLRREVPQRRRLLGDAHSAQPLAPAKNLDHCLDHVIDVALRVDPARDRQADQLHRRMRRLAGVWVDAAEHHTADLDGADAG